MAPERLIRLILIIVYVLLSILVSGRAARTGKCGLLKSVLMPLLVAALASKLLGSGLPDNPRNAFYVIAALTFSCVGDTFLERSEEGRIFLFGLGAFLTGHVLYILAALSQAELALLRPVFILFAIPYLILLVIMLKSLFPSVPKNMRAPVLAYMLVIITMSLAMLARIPSVPALSAALCLIGSVFFLVSDSILAHHVFRGTTFRGVMETYTAAQLLLTCGFLFS
jgi:uncharacterized membrane protein YhhN